MMRFTYEDELKAQGEDVPASVACDCCGRETVPFALVQTVEADGLEQEWICSICLLDHEQDQAEPPVTPAPSWALDCEIGNDRRATRQQLLAASDWTTLADVPLSPLKKAAWAAYRQSLRDMTETFSTPDEVVWPEKP